MTGKEFFEVALDKHRFEREKDFEVKLPKHMENLKILCELCSIEEEGFCCPEHCCDVSNHLFLIYQWDTCRCDHCKVRKAIARKKKHETETKIKEMKEDELHKNVYNV